MAGFLASLFEPSPRSLVKQVRAFEARWSGLSDEELRSKTVHFRERLRAGEDLFALLPEAFACVVIAAERTLGMRHFDVQIHGGVEMARGRIVEMKTGEGKTLVATLPAYLHALADEGVHIVTVNDYLAARDAEWMGPVYEALGLTVGCIQERMAETRLAEIPLRRAAYACDVTYVTNSEAVFDYLRDNLAYRPEEVVHRGFHYALVDEVDLLLIDEAQTPLIISGPGRDDAGLIRQADAAVRALDPGRHVVTDHRVRAAFLTSAGQERLEKSLEIGSLADAANLPWAHAVYQALQAHGVFQHDVDYIVAGDEIHIVDEHTGRVSPEKRYSNGLHQALEAKEGVTIRSEDLTLAKTSYQHYFRSYAGLAGMTGTAFSEREELRKTYRLKVVRVPTHRPMIREDYERVVYVTVAEKHDAVIDEILAARELGRPVLVGTVSVEESEAIARRLATLSIPHEVLNARHHRREAEIIAQAGRLGAVTISTNMAGRGTDIMLGGNARGLAVQTAEPGTAAFDDALRKLETQCKTEGDLVVKAGGLLVIGTGEHESVRIDDQLRGRSGRQGDPGSSVYFVSLDDPVYRRFGQKKALEALRDRLRDHESGEPVHDPTVLAALEELRKKVEVENQAIRLDVFKYDSVVHERRETIWGWRRSLIKTQDGEEWLASVRALIKDLLFRLEEEVDAAGDPEDHDARTPTARDRWNAILRRVLAWLTTEDLAEANVVEIDHGVELLFARYLQRHDVPRGLVALLVDWERQVLLDTIDMLWPQYLNDLERVEEGIWMRSYAQVDPFVEFRKEAAIMYGQLVRDIELNALRAWLSVQVTSDSAEGTFELPAGTLRFEAAGRTDPEPITRSTREAAATDLLDRGIPAPSERRTRRR